MLAAAVVVLRGGEDHSAQAAVRRAAARTLDASSSRFTLTIAVTQSLQQFPAVLSPPFAVEGLMDYVHHRGRISYGGGGNTREETIYDGDVVYTKWPLPWAKEKPWLRYEADAQDNDPFDLQDRAMRNPSGLLEFVHGAGTDVRNVGSENVRGIATTHYEGTLDLQKVVDQAPADKRAELQDFLNFIAEEEPTKVPFGLWVDEGGLAHRLRIDQHEGATTIEYYDFGVRVDV